MLKKDYNIVRRFTFSILLLSLVFVFTLPTFSPPTPALAQESAQQIGKDPVLRTPDTIEEARESILKVEGKIFQAIPRLIGKMWSEQILPMWRQMGNWTKEEIWEKRILPALQTISDRVKKLLGREVEKRTESAKERLEEQTERAKQDLWERFKALFRMD